MIVIDPKTTDSKNVYKLMIGCIVPRPIAFVSSVNPNGILNLAPFSFFMGVGHNPPSLAFSVTHRGSDGTLKDTTANISATKEFVVNVVTEEIAEQMNITAAEFSSEVDEFQISGFTPIPSDIVKPPRVKESPVNMECKLIQIVNVGDVQKGSSIIIGEIIRFHVEEKLLDNYRIDISQLHPIGRLAGNSYSRTRDVFDLVRPSTEELLLSKNKV